MSKRVLGVTQATIAAWNEESHPGVYVGHAILAEPDPARGWYVGTDIRTSQLVTIDGVEIAKVIEDGTFNGELPVGTVIETLNTIYKVV